MPRLRMIQAGIQRVYSHSPPTPSRLRMPITPSILHRIRDYWAPRAGNPDIVMLWAAVVLCFFGFFRAGELTVPTLQSFDEGKHLSWGSVAVDDIESPQLLQVTLKQSKTDQNRQGVQVYVGKTGCLLCPVAGVLMYMANRRDGAGPFFMFRDKKPLTKAVFTHKIRDVLQAIGLPYQNFAGHSFRIGAATAASRAGIEDSTIRMLGRWSSSAFLAYIRTPRDQLAALSANLART